jgi:hypothetical protein
MHCRDAKLWLNAQRDSDLVQSEAATPPELQEHLKHCPACRAYERRLQRLDVLFSTPAPSTYPGMSTLSTERIMLAVQQHRRITQQFEDIRKQQQFRMARLQIIGPSLVAIVFFALGTIPLLLVALTIIQPDVMAQILPFLSTGIGALVVLAEYLQTGLTLITRDNWMLSGIALVFVLLLGMWLRLMRYPQEA